MTVCIVAMTYEHHLVTVSDQKVSLHQFSGDNLTLKSYPVLIDGPWHCLVAGSDITAADSVLSGVLLKTLDQKKILMRTVTEAFTEAYQEQIARRAEALYLARYKMNMETFRDAGRKKLGPDVFDTLCDKISRVAFDLKFLVFGYDCLGAPHIFTVSNPGIEEVYDKPGFWAIGSGAMSALSMLFYRQQSRIRELEHTLYNVLEAKYMAESATDVGKHTFVSIIGKPGTKIQFPHELYQEIRTAWEKEGAPRVPSNIVSKIASKISAQDAPENITQSGSETSEPKQ